MPGAREESPPEAQISITFRLFLNIGIPLFEVVLLPVRDGGRRLVAVMMKNWRTLFSRKETVRKTHRNSGAKHPGPIIGVVAAA